ncbi:hypothetical protein BFJ68_g2539 [Fusarium oxysporum]|uniref:Uncharacterized protein n=1 Tax=Fusarium oxysporum TaxID=5507 RepID=A0A420RW35_FUSOX|nr:hypothetical protein BFJ68_g2539 [Fusarium oxysporum]
MIERKFQVIDKYEFNRTYHGIAISEQWQAWETAHFFRVKSIIENPTVGARLISYGCNNGDGSSLNCTKTCSNATLMYSSPENLWNCMTPATLGMLVGPGNDTIDHESEKKMDEKFHFGTVEKFNSLNIVTAYVIQLVLVLFLGLCFKLTTSWIRTFGRMSSSFQKDSVFRETCQRWQTTLSETRFAKAASSAMLDFQISQALFAATISITAIITFDGGNRAGLANMLTLFSWMFNHRILQGLITLFPRHRYSF